MKKKILALDGLTLVLAGMGAADKWTLRASYTYASPKA